MLVDERKAAIPCPGQPNRSTGFLYRLNTVAGCDVAECERPEPVCVITLQRLEMKHAIFGNRAILHIQAQLLPSLGRKALNTSRRLPETHGLTDVAFKYSTLLSTLLAVQHAMQAS